MSAAERALELLADTAELSADAAGLLRILGRYRAALAALVTETLPAECSAWAAALQKDDHE